MSLHGERIGYPGREAPSVFGVCWPLPRWRVYFFRDSFLRTSLGPSRLVAWLLSLQCVDVLGHYTRASILDHNMPWSKGDSLVVRRPLQWSLEQGAWLFM